MNFKYLAFLFIISGTLFAQSLDVQIGAQKAILINKHTGVVLFEKNADEPGFPSSMTKIATALYVLELCNNQLDEKVVVTKGAVASITPQAKKDSHYRSPPHWLETDGTHMGLKPGEELSIKDLLYSLLVYSANDACNVLALHFRDTVPQFMLELNDFLKKIGCRNTFFLNPHGLHHPQHVTTARDLACMAQYGLNNEIFRSAVCLPSYVCPRSNLEEERTLVQTNLFLRKGSYFDPRVIGVKTGRTQVAGSGMVTAAREGDRELISVVMECRCRADVLEDTKKLLDAAFRQPLRRHVFLHAGETSLTSKVKGTRAKLRTVLPEGVFYDFYPAEEEKVTAQVYWNIPRLPIKANAQVGAVIVATAAGRVIQKVPILAAEDLKRSWGSWYIGGGVGLMGLLILFLRRR